MDPLCCSLAFERLAPQELCRCAAACRQLRAAALAPEVWRPLCEQFFGRYYAPACLRARLGHEAHHPLTVLRDCTEDLARCEPSEEELTGLTWHFRFKETAGGAWTSQDPWWNGRPPVRVRFRPGGAVEREPAMAGVSIEWRWGPERTSLKCAVNGRDVPSYRFGRHPEHRGFFMHSCWALYAAFPLPARGEDPHMTDQALDLSAEEQLDEIQEYNFGAAGERQATIQLDNVVLRIPANLAALLQQVPAERRLEIVHSLLATRQAGDREEEGEQDGGDSSSSSSSDR